MYYIWITQITIKSFFFKHVYIYFFKLATQKLLVNGASLILDIYSQNKPQNIMKNKCILFEIFTFFVVCIKLPWSYKSIAIYIYFSRSYLVLTLPLCLEGWHSHSQGQDWDKALKRQAKNNIQLVTTKLTFRNRLIK